MDEEISEDAEIASVSLEVDDISSLIGELL